MPLPSELINAAVRGFSESQQPYRAGLPASQHSSIARLLLDAARMSLAMEAGFQPSKSQSHLPRPISSHEFPTCGFKAQQQLKLMLAKDYKTLLQQWLALLQDYQQRIPDELIPLLLDYGSKTGEIQSSLKQALGKRGLWLVQQSNNSHWEWLSQVGAHPRDYDSYYDAWRDYLIRLREEDPHQARELVESYWATLDGMMQIVLLKAFESNLVAEDIPFLEQVLGDESTRIPAARLLMQIPESEFREELEQKVGRLLAMVQLGHRQQWVVDFAWSPAFDGHPVQIQRTEASELCTIGNYSFNPEVLLMILPLSYWYKTYGVHGGDLAEAARNSTRPTMFYRIWTNLAIESQDGDFLFAMVLNLPRYSQSVARALSPEQKEAAAIHWLDKNPRFTAEHGVVPLLEAHTNIWGETLSKRLLESLEATFKDTPRPLLEVKLRNLLSSYAIYFPLSLKAEFERVIHVNERADFSESEQEQATAILHLLNFRAEMIAALEEEL